MGILELEAGARGLVKLLGDNGVAPVELEAEHAGNEWAGRIEGNQVRIPSRVDYPKICPAKMMGIV